MYNIYESGGNYENSEKTEAHEKAEANENTETETETLVVFICPVGAGNYRGIIGGMSEIAVRLYNGKEQDSASVAKRLSKAFFFAETCRKTAGSY